MYSACIHPLLCRPDLIYRLELHDGSSTPPFYWWVVSLTHRRRHPIEMSCNWGLPPSFLSYRRRRSRRPFTSIASNLVNGTGITRRGEAPMRFLVCRSGIPPPPVATYRITFHRKKSEEIAVLSIQSNWENHQFELSRARVVVVLYWRGTEMNCELNNNFSHLIIINIITGSAIQVKCNIYL